MFYTYNLSLNFLSHSVFENLWQKNVIRKKKKTNGFNSLVQLEH